MAYASVISLKQTITRLVYCQSMIFLLHGEILHSTLKEALSLQEVLESSDSSSNISSERLDNLDGEICEAVNKLEDRLEFDELDCSEVCSWQEINCIREGLKKMKEAYVKELDYSAPEDGNSSFNLAKIGDPHSGKRYENFRVFSLTGLAGTCRSILARSVFDDPEICLCFERRAWVKVGPNYDEREIHESIDAQLYAASSDYGSKCLIVVDNVQDLRICQSVISRYQSENTRILLSTSLKEVGRSPSISAYNIYTMSILNQQQSWDLLCRLLSAQLCPEPGSTIAENCKGLSLEIFKAALSLSKSGNTPPPPPKKPNSALELEDAYDEMSEISKVTEDVQLCYSCPGGDAENDVSSIIAEVLGLSYAIDYIKVNLFPVQPNLELKIASLFGMAGVGKTTRARKIFESSSHFDHRVWVTLGPKYRPERLMIDILAQIDLDIDKMRKRGAETLNIKKCLIVLDDVWSQTP